VVNGRLTEGFWASRSGFDRSASCCLEFWESLLFVKARVDSFVSIRWVWRLVEKSEDTPGGGRDCQLILWTQVKSTNRYEPRGSATGTLKRPATVHHVKDLVKLEGKEQKQPDRVIPKPQRRPRSPATWFKDRNVWNRIIFRPEFGITSQCSTCWRGKAG
jgi:hypothetical protein